MAEALSVARTTITAIEKGERRAQPDDIIRMASLFGRAVSDLVGKRESIPDFAVQFRTAVKTADSPRAEMELSQAVQDFRTCVKTTCIWKTSARCRCGRITSPTTRFRASVWRRKRRRWHGSEHNRLGLGDGPILNLREVLENEVSMRIFSIDLPSRIAGMFSFTDELGGCIAVNGKHPAERRRWTMAHEYAHFLTSRFHSEISLLGGYSRVPAEERFADASRVVF